MAPWGLITSRSAGIALTGIGRCPIHFAATGRAGRSRALELPPKRWNDSVWLTIAVPARASWCDGSGSFRFQRNIGLRTDRYIPALQVSGPLSQLSTWFPCASFITAVIRKVPWALDLPSLPWKLM